MEEQLVIHEGQMSSQVLKVPQRAVLRPRVSGEALARPQGDVQREEEEGGGGGEGHRRSHCLRSCPVSGLHSSEAGRFFQHALSCCRESRDKSWLLKPIKASIQMVNQSDQYNNITDPIKCM